MTKTLHIIVLCDDLVLPEGRTNEFFKLIAKLDSFRFSKQEDGFLRIELNVANIWELVHE